MFDISYSKLKVKRWKKNGKKGRKKKHQFILSNTQRINNHLKILEPRYINSFFLHNKFVYIYMMNNHNDKFTELQAHVFRFDIFFFFCLLLSLYGKWNSSYSRSRSTRRRQLFVDRLTKKYKSEEREKKGKHKWENV